MSDDLKQHRRDVSHWYALRHAPQEGKKAARELRGAGLRVYIPKLSVETRNRRTRQAKIQWRPLVTGYLFVRYPDGAADDRGLRLFGVIRKCESVAGILTGVGAAGENWPLAIADRLIVGFIQRQRRREFGPATVETPARRLARLHGHYRPGKLMTISAGPFEKFLAEITKLDDDETVTVTVFGNGGAVPKVRLGRVEDFLGPLPSGSLVTTK